MGCSWKLYDCAGEALDWVGDQVTDGAGAVIGSAVEAFAEAIGRGAEAVMDSLNGVWLGISPETSATQLGEQPAGSMTNIANEVDWLVGYIAVACVLVAAFRMALDRKGQPMQQAFAGLWKVILVSAVATSAAQLLIKASDAYAEYLYGKAELDDSGAAFAGGTVIGLMSTSPGLVIIFGLLAILAAFIQIVLMLIRVGVLVILVGTLPLAAASSMTGWGSGWWKKHIGWLIAWLLYKPAAALIIFAGKTMMNEDDDILTVISGLCVLILAIFALPSLLKLVVPATEALGSSSGGGIAMNAANNVATGAVSIAGGAAMSGGGGGGGAGQQGAKGPQGSPSSGGGATPSGGQGAGAGAGGGGAGGGASGAGAGAAKAGAGAAGGAAAGAATGGASAAVQGAAVAAQTAMQAGTEVVNSLGDADGAKGHNE